MDGCDLRCRCPLTRFLGRLIGSSRLLCNNCSVFAGSLSMSAVVACRTTILFVRLFNFRDSAAVASSRPRRGGITNWSGTVVDPFTLIFLRFFFNFFALLWTVLLFFLFPLLFRILCAECEDGCSPSLLDEGDNDGGTASEKDGAIAWFKTAGFVVHWLPEIRTG
jgi:hypothetical protein